MPERLHLEAIPLKQSSSPTLMTAKHLPKIRSNDRLHTWSLNSVAHGEHTDSLSEWLVARPLSMGSVWAQPEKETWVHSCMGRPATEGAIEVQYYLDWVAVKSRGLGGSIPGCWNWLLKQWLPARKSWMVIQNKDNNLYTCEMKNETHFSSVLKRPCFYCFIE